MGNVGGTMVGVGDAYYNGQRMAASEALARAGLQPIAPFAADDAALVSTNAFTAGQAALLVHDTQRMLDWAELSYAMDLQGMNSSVTPIATIVQQFRPFPFQNQSAARTLRAIGGSYLFNLDPNRIIQDPESLRASSQRNGSAWEAVQRLKKNTLIQINSSDHNPAVAPGVSPSSAPELATPWFMQYHVAGGPNNQGQEGYILSNANWDPISVTNDIENLTIANANLAAAIAQRIQRFSNTFFTVVAPADVVPAAELAQAAPTPSDYNLADLMAEIQTLANPVPAQGNAIVRNVEDLEAEGRIKVSRARLTTDNVLQLIALDVATSTFWMDIRRIQEPARTFGVAPTPAWQAYRTVVPWQAAAGTRPLVPLPTLAYSFVSANDAADFLRGSGETAAAFRRTAAKAIRAARARTLRFASTPKARNRYLAVQAAEPVQR
jgi:histidine ammonia-lyase